MGELLKMFFIYEQETTFKKPEEIYSQRKSPNPAGGFRYKKTKRINSTTLSKNFKRL